MTITFNKVPALTGAKVADVSGFSFTNFRVVKSEVINSAREVGTVSTHTYVQGDAEDELMVIVRRAYNVDQDITRNSVRLVIDVEDDTLEDPEIGPIEVGIFWNHPGKHSPDNAQIARAIAAAFNTVVHPFDGTTGAPVHSVVNMIDNGITEEPWS